MKKPPEGGWWLLAFFFGWQASLTPRPAKHALQPIIKFLNTVKTTPAVAAGLAQERWTVEELIERTACDVPPQPEWEAYLDSLPK